MNSRSDQFQRYCHLRIKLEDAIELVGPGDLVLSYPPGKAADAGQMLCFSKERFTSLERRFTQGALYRDAGNVGELRDEILLNLGWARRFALEYGERPQYLSVSCVYWGRPL